MNRVSVCISLLFILAIGLSLPSWLKKEQDLAVDQTEEAWIPNYQAKKMRSTLYDKMGKVNHQVYAAGMENFDLLGFTLFKQPEYWLYAQSKHPWKVNALEATLYDDQRLQFETDVEIANNSQDGYVQTIKTNFVEVNLEAKTMKSDQAVTIIGPNYIITSNGLSVSLETQRYELLDHVETIYQPTTEN